MYEYYNIIYSNKAIQVQLQEGMRGSQDGYLLESVKILNAAPLQDSIAACYLSVKNNLKPVGLGIEYLGSDNVLKLSGLEKPVRFSDIHSIHIAASGELNVCSGDHFRYRIYNNI